MNSVVAKKPDNPGPAERARRQAAAARLREAIAYRGVPSQAQVAAMASIGTQAIGDALAGLRKTDSKTWRKLAVALRHQMYWLTTGLGERFMSEAEAEAEALELKMHSQARLVPVSSDGVERWLAQWGDLLKITPTERERLHRVPWPDPTRRYSDMVYKGVLDALRLAQQNPSPDHDQP